MRWLWRKSAQWTLLTALLRERAIVVALLGFAFVYLLFSFFEIPLWRCAWKEVTGWRCPGCGLTRGCKAFLRGDFEGGLAWNWLTPLILLGLFVLPVLFAIPRTMREGFLDKLEVIEGKSRLVLVFGLLLIVQTFARLQGWA